MTVWERPSDRDRAADQPLPSNFEARCRHDSETAARRSRIAAKAAPTRARPVRGGGFCGSELARDSAGRRAAALIPATLRPVEPIDPAQAVRTRQFLLRKGSDECTGDRWEIRSLSEDSVEVGSHWDDDARARVEAAARAAARPITDKRGTAEFRTHVAGVLAGRVDRIEALGPGTWRPGNALRLLDSMPTRFHAKAA